MIVLLVLLLVQWSLATDPRFPRPLSPIADKIYKAVVASARSNPRKSPLDVGLMASSGTLVNDVLDYGNTTTFPQFYRPVILHTRHELIINSFIFAKRTPLADGIYQALVDLSAQVVAEKREPVHVYVMLDPFGALYFNRQFAPLKTYLKSLTAAEPTKFGLPDSKKHPGIKIHLKTFHKGALGLVHDKLVISDGEHALIGSKNVDADICQEYMMHLKGSVAESLRDNFERTWGEPLLPLKRPPLQQSPENVPMVVFGRTTGMSLFSHNADQPQAAGLFAAFDAAQESIFLQTLNFNEKKIARKLVETIKRGVRVTLLTAYKMADKEERMHRLSVGTNEKTAKWIYKQLNDQEQDRFTFCWWIGHRNHREKPHPHPKEWSHVKALIIDEKVAIVGSANMDPYSWYHQHEINIAIDDAGVARTLLNKLKGQTRSLEPGVCSKYDFY
jgi:phosphatidylserine/phosphatidylglycerophosphate/cardiolipin synthase-like enzyme